MTERQQAEQDQHRPEPPALEAPEGAPGLAARATGTAARRAAAAGRAPPPRPSPARPSSAGRPWWTSRASTPRSNRTYTRIAVATATPTSDSARRPRRRGRSATTSTTATTSATSPAGQAPAQGDVAARGRRPSGAAGRCGGTRPPPPPAPPPAGRRRRRAHRVRRRRVAAIGRSQHDPPGREPRRPRLDEADRRPPVVVATGRRGSGGRPTRSGLPPSPRGSCSGT